MKISWNKRMAYLFSILIGTTFDWKDIACYGVGCVMTGLWEIWMRKQSKYNRK